MFDPLAIEQYVIQNPVETITHLVAYSSAAVAGLATVERLLRAMQDWSDKWFPALPLSGWLAKGEYGVAAAADLIEMLALNWREKIAPKKREVWNDAKRQEQLGEKSSAAGAGK